MKKDLIIHEAPKSPVSEAIRTLRTSITYKMTKNHDKVFLITSSSIEEGKSWVVSNLAIAFTQSKQKVLIIDADLRKGRQANIFSLDNSYGLANILDNSKITIDNPNLDEEIKKSIFKTQIANLFVMPSGIFPSKPSELLENKQFDIILEKLKSEFDIILFDAPPINIVTDSMILCNKADSVIVVCAIGKTKRESIIETKKKIISMGGSILGVVINKMPIDKLKEYTKDYTKYNNNKIIKIDNPKLKNIS